MAPDILTAVLQVPQLQTIKAAKLDGISMPVATVIMAIRMMAMTLL